MTTTKRKAIEEHIYKNASGTYTVLLSIRDELFRKTVDTLEDARELRDQAIQARTHAQVLAHQAFQYFWSTGRYYTPSFPKATLPKVSIWQRIRGFFA